MKEYESERKHFQEISIDVRKGVLVSAIFGDRNSFKTLLGYGLLQKDIQIRTD